MASSQSGETIGTVRSALHQAICEQSFAIACETDPAIIERATAAKDACEQLDHELANAGSAHILVNELTLRVPHAATWLPLPLQALVGSQVKLGAAIRHEAEHATEATALRTIAGRLL